MARRLAVAGVAALAAITVVGQVAATPRDPVARRTVVLGRSVGGRAIVAVETGDFDSPRKTLVVGCIHGDECAGVAVARQLARAAPQPGADLWIVADLNPDGAAAGTRGNARGVDLNRNFPRRWSRLRGVHFSGPRPSSEPETRIAERLIARVRPSVSIWFHQHLDLVDVSSGSLALERRFARVAGLRLARLAQEPGSAVGWESHCLPAGSAFVVELPAGPLVPSATLRLARAVEVTAASAPARRAAGPWCGAGR